MSELHPLFKEGKVVNNLWYPLFFDLWYIYLHLVEDMVNVSKYTMDCGSYGYQIMYPCEVWHGNLRIHPWKRKIIFQTIIFKFHVKLSGCVQKATMNSDSLSESDHLWVINFGWLGIMWCQLCLPILSGRWIYISRWWFQIFLVGGFKHLLFSPLPGEIIQLDEHIFQMGWNHQLDFLFSPRKLEKYGEMIPFDSYNSIGLVQPPTIVLY